MLIGGAIVGFFVNGMFAGYGAMITRLYPHQIRSTANNVILNVGRAVGGFSSVIIGKILDISDVSTVMIFLASLSSQPACSLDDWKPQSKCLSGFRQRVASRGSIILL